METDYKIIRLKRENNKLINKLLESASEIHNRKKDSIEWFKWKYFGSPFGESICLLALINEEIAGEVTFGRYEFLLNGEIKKCLISYQTMVHPKHQKKGLFSKLTKEIMKIAENENLDLIFNFPNRASYKPFIRLNYTPINHIKNYLLVANKINFVKNITSIKKPFFANHVTKINSNDKNVLKELKPSITPLNIPDLLLPNRTLDFLKWRYFTQPLYDYRIIKTDLGWSIIRTGKRGNLKEVQLMEFYPNESFNKSFIKSITQEIKNVLNPDIILLNISNNHPLNNSVKKVGFLSLPHNISFFTFTFSNELSGYSNQKKWIITATEFHRY